MAIQYVGGQTVDIGGVASANTTITFALTGGAASTPAVGDLVVVSYSIGTNAVDLNMSTRIITTGYTSVADLFQTNTRSTNQGVYYKLMGATPDTTVVVGPTTNTTYTGVVLIQVFRGISSTSPLDVTSTTVVGTSSGSPDPPAITPAATGNWIIVTGATATGGATTYTTPGYLTNFRSICSATGTYVGMGGIGYVTGQSAGVSYNPAAWTASPNTTAQSWSAVTLALRPGDTASLAATEAVDTAAFAVTVVPTIALAATEAIDTAAFSVNASLNISLAATEAADVAVFAVTAIPSIVLAATEAIDTASFALSARTDSALAATEAIDTAAFALSARTDSALAVTEAIDTAAFALTAKTNAALAVTEAIDTAAFALTAKTNAALAATEARDIAAFAIIRAVSFPADFSTYTYTGYEVTFQSRRNIAAEYATYQVNGNLVSLTFNRNIIASNGIYTLAGYGARLYESSFFYSDNEIIYVPWGQSSVAVPGKNSVNVEIIYVPWTQTSIMISEENRTIVLPPAYPVEELAEYRTETAEPRLRVVS